MSTRHERPRDTQRSRAPKSWPVVCVGLFLVAAGLVLNEWVVAKVFSADGSVDAFSTRMRIWFSQVLVIGTGLLLVARRRQVSRSGLACKIFEYVFLLLYSGFISSLALFSIVELFPSLIERFDLHAIHYYGLRGWFDFDDELVFRAKSGARFEIPDFKGDLYSPSLGIDVPVLAYEVSFDEDGFRNPDSRPHSDVVITGDSFMEIGLDESDTFSARLSRISGLSTKNLALGGYGPFQYLITLEKYGVAQRPRHALFCFFEGNDAEDIAEFMKWRAGGSFYHFNLTSKGYFLRYLVAVKDVVAFLADVLTRGLDRNAADEKQDQAEVHPDLVKITLHDKGFLARFGFTSETRPADELLLTREWVALRDILRSFRNVCLQNDIMPAVVFVPTKAHIYGVYTTEGSASNWLRVRDEQIAARQNTETAVTRMCDELDLSLISLTPLLDSLAAQGEFLYYAFDTHWNSDAREHAAALVAEHLGAAAFGP